MANGCPIGNTGWSFVLEGYYNADAIRRFGTGLFGSGLFGDGADTAVNDWIDITAYAHSVEITRGSDLPTINIPTDMISWIWRDFPADWIEWVNPQALASPTVGTPIRAGLQRTGDPDSYRPVGQFRLYQIRDIHDTPEREVEMLGYGTKTDLVTPLLLPDRPKENAKARIAAVLAEIGWQWGVTYPDDLDTFGLEGDGSQGWQVRTGERALAWSIIFEAAASAGYAVAIANDGSLIFVPLEISENPVAEAVYGDCASNLVDAVTTSIDFTADGDAVLNVVQLVNEQHPNRSVEATDPSSVAIYGRRASGYGFPLTVVNDDLFDAQTVADKYLEQTAMLVNRIENVGFNTAVDPRWFDVLADAYIGQTVNVKRFHPRPLTVSCGVIGGVFSITPEYIEGTVNLSTRTITAGVGAGYLQTSNGDQLTDSNANYLTT